ECIAFEWKVPNRGVETAPGLPAGAGRRRFRCSYVSTRYAFYCVKPSLDSVVCHIVNSAVDNGINLPQIGSGVDGDDGSGTLQFSSASLGRTPASYLCGCSSLGGRDRHWATLC